jgi:hypothetical protein
MSAPTVDSILNQIRQLPEPERLILEQRLAELLEAEWQREVESARQLARDRGIDQTAIDQAIHDDRYGT